MGLKRFKQQIYSAWCVLDTSNRECGKHENSSNYMNVNSLNHLVKSWLIEPKHWNFTFIKLQYNYYDTIMFFLFSQKYNTPRFILKSFQHISSNDRGEITWLQKQLFKKTFY